MLSDEEHVRRRSPPVDPDSRLFRQHIARKQAFFASASTQGARPMSVAGPAQSRIATPSVRIAAATTRLFWPGRFLLATSRRPGESCTGGDRPVSVA